MSDLRCNRCRCVIECPEARDVLKEAEQRGWLLDFYAEPRPIVLCEACKVIEPVPEPGRRDMPDGEFSLAGFWRDYGIDGAP